MSVLIQYPSGGKERRKKKEGRRKEKEEGRGKISKTIVHPSAVVSCAQLRDPKVNYTSRKGGPPFGSGYGGSNIKGYRVIMFIRCSAMLVSMDARILATEVIIVA